LISFNNFNGFVQQFHWICLAILPLLLLPSVVFAVRFRQSWPYKTGRKLKRQANAERLMLQIARTNKPTSGRPLKKMLAPTWPFHG
jgi:hypothetical protein